MSDSGLLLLSPEDNVAVARVPLTRGSTHRIGPFAVVLAQDVPAGFKVAVRDIVAGEKILKYGAPIGSATQPIKHGEIAHLENMKSDYLATHLRGGSTVNAGDHS